MNKILIASNNRYKFSEIASVLSTLPDIKLYSLKDFGINVDVTEDGNTLEENALIKAKAIYDLSGVATLSDDTGLFVKALNGEPGVYSARYAGEKATYEDNCIKLLKNLKDISDENRTAQFESVICFYVNEKEHYFFKGVCSGKIINEKRGKSGFGYDPLFEPNGYEKTFAEMTNEDKNKISHRSKALEAFRKFISLYYT